MFTKVLLSSACWHQFQSKYNTLDILKILLWKLRNVMWCVIWFFFEKYIKSIKSTDDPSAGVEFDKFHILTPNMNV